MKLLTIIYAFVFSINLYGQEYYFVNAENGLNVRSEPNAAAEQIVKIPFGAMVKKLVDTNKPLIISDNGQQIKGNWIKVMFDYYPYLITEEKEQLIDKGYVFDGYLTKEKSDDIIIEVTKIELLEFNKLSDTVSKQDYKPIKIKVLDSIKTILKDRVDWVTEVDENGNKREDIIKSITKENGQQLILNQEFNDYGFADGWSGYYPDYDILVLEGGHASDMCFSIKTGETTQTCGNPEYIIPSPQNTYRLNGTFGGQECITYFFQKKINGKFFYLTQFNWDFDICKFKAFYWISETKFIYSKMSYQNNSANGQLEYFLGEIKTTKDK